MEKQREYSALGVQEVEEEKMIEDKNKVIFLDETQIKKIEERKEYWSNNLNNSHNKWLFFILKIFLETIEEIDKILKS